jgi:hypothetical protein
VHKTRDIHLKPNSDAYVESYTVGTTTFLKRVEFHDSADAKDWTIQQDAEGGKLEYSLEAFETGTRLYRKEFEVYGTAGRSIPNEEMSNPTVKIRCGNIPTVIPAGTPIAFAVQKYRGVPTYRWDRELGYNREETPESISVVEGDREADQIVAVPSREMQADYELQAAEVLEGTMRRSMRNYKRQGTTVTRDDGDTKSKTYKQESSDESAQRAMRNTQLMEALEEARDNKMEAVTKEDLGDKLQRTIRTASYKRQGRVDKVDREEEVARTIKDAELSRLEGAGREDKLAKLLIQMMWHLKSVARVGTHDAEWKREEFKEGQHETLTAQVSTRGDSQAIKAVLRQLRIGLRSENWRQWRERHKEIASVKALTVEVEHVRDDANSVEGIFRAETEKEHFAQANVEMEELYEMLTNDTAADDNKMAAIMEQKISIQEHFQKKDGQGKCIPMLDAKGKSIYEDVHPRSVMELIDEEWSSAIRKACELEVDDNGVHVEDEDRITRMATYMMMVSVDRIKHDTDKVNLLFKYILQREPFYNINPNNPPRFRGADFDYVRLKQGAHPLITADTSAEHCTLS